jgi:hypothetical protein
MHSFSIPNIWQVQGLQQTNHLPRKTFSEWFLRKHAGNLDFPPSISFTVEAGFSMHFHLPFYLLNRKDFQDME